MNKIQYSSSKMYLDNVKIDTIVEIKLQMNFPKMMSDINIYYKLLCNDLFNNS